MRINKDRAKELLLNRLQCMRDYGNVIDDITEDLILHRGLCCGYLEPSSSSSSSPPSSSSSSSSETFFLLDESNDIQQDESGDLPILEEAP